MNTSAADQEAAARRDLQNRMRAVLPPGTPHVTADPATDPLYLRAAAALDLALNEEAPERRCPHVRGVRPYVLDMWRGLLYCGRCRRDDQYRLLPGGEEHACDRCGGQVTPADECWVAMSLAGFITCGAMVCPGCWQSYTGTPPPPRVGAGR